MPSTLRTTVGVAESKASKERGLHAIAAMFVVIAVAAGVRHEFVPAVICAVVAVGCHYRATQLQKPSAK